MPGNDVTTIQSISNDALSECLSFLSQNELLKARNVNRSFEESALKNLKQRELTLSDVATRGYHTIALMHDKQGRQKLFAWGYNEFGQLGLGNNVRRSKPQSLDMGFLPAGAQITQLVAGAFHTLIHTRTADGNSQLFAWGYNRFGQLGLGDNANRNTPQALDMGFLPAGAQITKLAAVGAHTLIQAQTATGKSLLFACGYNEPGQLGLGHNAHRNTPQPLDMGFLPAGAQITQLVAGGFHTLIQMRTADGKSQLFSWGNNQFGQLGLGDNPNRNTPQALDMNFLNGAQITQLVAGGFHTLIQTRTADGNSQLFAWGDNGYGQLGLGDNANRNTPQALDMNFLAGAEITRVVAGGFHTLIQTRTADGNSQLFAWGDNRFGQLGLGGKFNRNIPRRLRLGPFKPAAHHQLYIGQTERQLARLERPLLSNALRLGLGVVVGVSLFQNRESQLAGSAIAAGLLGKAQGEALQHRRRKAAIAYHDKSVKKRQSRSYRLGFESATSNCSYFLSYFKVCGKKANREWHAGYAAGLLAEETRKQKYRLIGHDAQIAGQDLVAKWNNRDKHDDTSLSLAKVKKQAVGLLEKMNSIPGKHQSSAIKQLKGEIELIANAVDNIVIKPRFK